MTEQIAVKRTFLKIDTDLIGKVCREIAERFQPLKIILFGSYAHGSPTPDSDVDLLVIMPFSVSPYEQAVNIREYINRNGVRFPMDIIVRTPEFVKYRFANEDWFMREIIEKGVVMHEAINS